LKIGGDLAIFDLTIKRKRDICRSDNYSNSNIPVDDEINTTTAEFL
jgi:hypothetical protein